MMDDKELMGKLREKAMGLGFDTRFLIEELIKRYMVRDFQVRTLSGKSIFGPRHGEFAGYDVEELICVAELLRRNLIQKEELGTLLGDCYLMYSIVLRMMKQERRKLENGVECVIRFPGASEAVQAMLDEKYGNPSVSCADTSPAGEA